MSEHCEEALHRSSPVNCGRPSTEHSLEHRWKHFSQCQPGLAVTMQNGRLADCPSRDKAPTTHHKSNEGLHHAICSADLSR